jgi:hypothetical protein
MTYSLQLSVLLGALVGLGLFVAVLAVVGLPERVAGRPTRRRRRATAQERTRRLVIGLVAGGLALLLTRWIVAGVAIGLLGAFWDRIAGGAAVERVGISRLEAMASWTESLRDTIAGAVGLEQAIPATAVNAGTAVRPSLNLLVDRLRIRAPLRRGHRRSECRRDLRCAGAQLAPAGPGPARRPYRPGRLGP